MSLNPASVRILHLDDSVSDSMLIKAMIEGANHELQASVEPVCNKEAYLAALRSRTIDLILSDHRMPGYDGDEALRDAKALCPDIPFIMVTGEMGEERAIETLKEGATDYVLKDRLQRLIPSIKRALKDAHLEHERRETTRRLIEAQRIAHIGNWEWNIQTGEVHWSAEIFSIYGVDPDAFVPTFNAFAQFIHPDDREFVNRKVTEILGTGGPVNFDFRIISADGSPHVLHTVGEIAKSDAQGKPLVMVGTNQDITERKQMEEALRHAHDELEQRVQARTAALKKTSEALQAERQRFMDVLDVLPAYVILLTPDYQVLFANRFFEERFGKSQGRRCYEYLFNRTGPCEVCETYKVLKARIPLKWEWTGPDGRIYDISDFPFTDTDGSQLILEMGLDITERRRSEAELEQHRHHLDKLVQERTGQLSTANEHLLQEIAERKQMQEALKATEDNLRLLVSGAAEAMMVLDSAGVIEAVSPLGAGILGYEEAELAGKSIDQFADTFSRLEAFLTLEDIRKRAPESRTVIARVKTKTGDVQRISLTVRIVNAGTKIEKYFLKFSVVDLPPAKRRPAQ